MILQEDIDFLEHFGTKGMQWGVRRRENQAKQLKLNDASRAKERAADAKNPTKNHAEAVDRARTKVNTGATRRDLKDARLQYKQDKVNIGKREAQIILAKSRSETYATIAKAQEARDGWEAATRILDAISTDLAVERMNRRTTTNTPYFRN
jgi:hypothetical protein